MNFKKSVLFLSFCFGLAHSSFADWQTTCRNRVYDYCKLRHAFFKYHKIRRSEEGWIKYGQTYRSLKKFKIHTNQCMKRYWTDSYNPTTRLLTCAAITVNMGKIADQILDKKYEYLPFSGDLRGGISSKRTEKWARRHLRLHQGFDSLFIRWPARLIGVATLKIERAPILTLGALTKLLDHIQYEMSTW